MGGETKILKGRGGGGGGGGGGGAKLVQGVGALKRGGWNLLTNYGLITSFIKKK